MSRVLFLVSLSLWWLVGTARQSHGHAHWLSPPPRDNSTGYKDPQGPCGPPARTTPMVLSSGQTLSVSFQETVDHPGCFLIDLSQANDQNWQFIANIPHKTSPATPRDYSTQITLPAGVACSACTLRVRQIMLGSDALPCPPNPIPDNSTYYSCADVAINSVANPDMGAAATPDLAMPATHVPSEGGAQSTGCQALPAGFPSPLRQSLAALVALMALAGLGLHRMAGRARRGRGA